MPTAMLYRKISACSRPTGIGARLAAHAVRAAQAAYTSHAARTIVKVEKKNPWPSNDKGYELRDVIGVGATAVVNAALCSLRNEKCAIKRINLRRWNISMEELTREIQAMSCCLHKNVVAYYTSFIVQQELWLVLNLLEGGSLLDLIKNKMRKTNCKNGVFDETVIATVLKEVLQGIEYFHSNGQIHRDIKAGNILLNLDGSVKIADFGVSAWLATSPDSTHKKLRHTFVGTPCWMAPEVMEQDRGYDFKADIWSFGITAIEMATGTAPYHKYPPMKVLMLTLQNNPPTLETGADQKDQYKAYGKSFRKMINVCLQKDPSKRPSAKELLKHAFFKKAKDRKCVARTLVQCAPPIGTRTHKTAKRESENLLCQYRVAPGGWLWSKQAKEIRAEEESSSSDSGPENLPLNKVERVASSDSDHEKQLLPVKKTQMEATKLKAPPTFTEVGATAKDAAQGKADVVENVVNHPLVHLVLRLRNASRELQDIRFDFTIGKDTALGLATELVDAGLVKVADKQPVVVNLQKLIEGRATKQRVTFKLNSPVEPGEVYDQPSLVGYAQIAITNDAN